MAVMINLAETSDLHRGTDKHPFVLMTDIMDLLAPNFFWFFCFSPPVSIIQKIWKAYEILVMVNLAKNKLV